MGKEEMGSSMLSLANSGSFQAGCSPTNGRIDHLESECTHSLYVNNCLCSSSYV